jgi:hypothetical protein
MSSSALNDDAALRLRLMSWIALPLIRAGATRQTGENGSLERAVPAIDALVRRAAEAGVAVARDLGVSDRGDSCWRAARVAAELLGAEFAHSGKVLEIDAVCAVVARSIPALELASEPVTMREFDTLEGLVRVAAVIGRWSFGHEPEAVLRLTIAELKKWAERIADAAATTLDSRNAAYHAAFSAAAALLADAYLVEQRALLEFSPHLRVPRKPLPLDRVWRRLEASIGLVIELMHESTTSSAA